METNYLQNKKVSVKIVEKTKSGFLKNSDGNTIWTGCKRTYQAPTNQFDRIIQLLNKDEQAWFEKIGLETGFFERLVLEKIIFGRFKVILDKKEKYWIYQILKIFILEDSFSK